jgi:hypothetical protein
VFLFPVGTMRAIELFMFALTRWLLIASFFLSHALKLCSNLSAGLFRRLREIVAALKVRWNNLKQSWANVFWTHAIAKHGVWLSTSLWMQCLGQRKCRSRLRDQMKKHFSDHSCTCDEFTMSFNHS